MVSITNRKLFSISRRLVSSFFGDSDIRKGNYQAVNTVFLCPIGHDLDAKPPIVTCRNLFFTENKSMKNLAGIVKQCRILQIGNNIGYRTSNIACNEFDDG